MKSSLDKKTSAALAADQHMTVWEKRPAFSGAEQNQKL